MIRWLVWVAVLVALMYAHPAQHYGLLNPAPADVLLLDFLSLAWLGLGLLAMAIKLVRWLLGNKSKKAQQGLV